MNLFKTSVLNGIAVLIKTATMFIITKILAIYVGPSGYAVIGQFQNFIQIITSFSGGVINAAVIKYTAEYYKDEDRQRAIWRAAGSIIFLCSIIMAVIILLLQRKLSLYVFETDSFQSIFVWFAIFLIFFNFNAFLLAILNGKKEILKLVIANIVGSFFSLAITTILVIKFQLYGALLALSIYQATAFLVTLTLCYKADWFKFKDLFGKIESDIAKKFVAFAFMMLIGALCAPLSQIFIRTYLGSQFGVEYAGYWEAMIRLSGAYLMLVTTTLSVYYLPRLSELSVINEIKKEVYLGYKVIFPVALLGAIIVYLLRDWIIRLLFTDAFLPMRELFLWQLIGDSLKIGSWILASLMISKAMTKMFIFTEIFFSALLVFLTYLFTKFFGFEGVSIAYFVNYAIYWIVVGLFVFKALRNRESSYAA